MTQRLGRSAQDHFKLLCSQARITCNSPQEDDHGWDFMIELTPAKDVEKPADKIPGVQKALIQIKTAYGKSPRTRIKVVNALKFAKDELPCFIVLFHHPAIGETQIYGQHFWKQLIKRALKRGRQASAENKMTHKIWMDIRFSANDNHGTNLISWIVSTLQAWSGDYGSAKRTLYETLGYEDRKYRAEVTFGPIEGIEDIVDHELGLTDFLPVSKIRLVDSRFGIDAPVPILESDRGRIQIRPNTTRTCTVVLQISTGERIAFEASVRTPAFPNLPVDKFKIAIETWCFTAIIHTDATLTIEVKVLWNENLSIEKLRDLATFLSWGGKELSMKFSGEDVPILNSRGTFSSTGHEMLFAELSSVAKMLGEIEARAGCTSVRLTMYDLRGSLEELKFVRSILTGGEMQLVAGGGPPWKIDIPLSKLLGYFEFLVGGVLYFVVFEAPITDWSTERDGLRVNCGDRILADCYAGEAVEEIRQAGMLSHEAEGSRYGDECLDLGDFRALLGG